MDYPKMKATDRKSLYKDIRGKAFPIENERLSNTEDLARFLNGK